MPDTTPPAITADDRLSIGEEEAARLTGLSAKTLYRLANRGELLGRFKVGNRTLYHRPTLAAWIADRAGVRAPALTA